MRKIFALLVIILCVVSTNKAFCAPSRQQQAHDWVWNVLVIPPSGGWNTEPGISINTALSWVEREISESSNGIGGHDVHFTRLNISGDLASVQKLRLDIGTHTAAVMSFALASDVDSALVARLAGRDVPLMIAGGESVLIDSRNVFALDLYRDYRAAAFTEYARAIYDKDKRIALAASRFTVNQEREAKICYNMLDAAGFMPMPYWADASARDSFIMMSEEIESYEGEKAGVVISFMGGMGAREIWRNFMRLRSSWRLWNCAEPDDTYLSCRGMIFADQNILLDSAGGFIETKRMLWRSRAMQVSDSVAAGRAVALYEWLKRAVDMMPQPVDNIPRAALLRNLERVQAVPFGRQVLNIAPGLHRPTNRDVYIVDVHERAYRSIDVVNVRGLAYVPSY